MADRPIIFSGPMVRALLAGRKTQTRRILTPQPETFLADGCECEVRAVHVAGEPLPRLATGRCLTRQKLRYAKGDRLYVREAWAPLSACTHYDPGTQAMVDRGFYRADGSTIDGEIDRWRPSIHMPRWASRLTLIVEDVRVEPLQEISTDDVLAEGAPLDPNHHDGTQDGSNPVMCIGDRPWTSQSPHAWYHRLWDSLHGKGAWETNPFVVALTFRVEHSNIDRIAS